MRQGRSSKHEIKEMEIEKISKLREEPHLSGAYIRSLVKQLTSSKTKDSMNPKELDSSSTVVDADSIPAQNLTKFAEGLEETQHTQQTQQQQQQQQQQPQQHKKQVRRRLHTSRPYQERLLNMAEARREIVTALKFHRAAMKQASEQQQGQQEQQQLQQQPQLPSVQPPQHPCVEQESGRMKSRRNPRIYPSATSNFSNYLDNLSYTPNFPHHHHPSPNPFAWSASPIATLPVAENLNFTLPNQTLGLNLNFHDFNNIDTSLYHNSNINNNNLSFYSTSTSNSVSSPSSSSSPTLCTAADQEVPGSGSGAAIKMEVGPPVVGDVLESSATTSSGGGGLHAAMDDEEMAEIRSIGEQHQMEWNDTMNLVTSAWWFKFLKTMELGGPNMKSEDDDDHGYHPFDEVMEFSSWLSANESETCFQQHFDDYCSEDYFQNPALPCMDIGEFEGMDGEWLA